MAAAGRDPAAAEHSGRLAALTVKQHEAPGTHAMTPGRGCAVHMDARFNGAPPARSPADRLRVPLPPAVGTVGAEPHPLLAALQGGQGGTGKRGVGVAADPWTRGVDCDDVRGLRILHGTGGPRPDARPLPRRPPVGSRCCSPRSTGARAGAAPRRRPPPCSLRRRRPRPPASSPAPYTRTRTSAVVRLCPGFCPALTPLTCIFTSAG